ncbi:MAG: PAS domain-containing protein, partial [Planctomycetota bacterium]|nr:PAS domain-containing protein [Planctomycetota bacterium]
MAEEASPAGGDIPPSAPPDLRELAEIIQAYSAATDELRRSHELLQEQVTQLTGELSRKNRELSDTVTQVSSLKNFLSGVIQSSADGIVAIDLTRRIMAWNPAANVLSDIDPALPENPEGMFVMDVMRGPCREFAMMLMRSMHEDKAFRGVEMRLVDVAGRTRYFSASASPVWNDEDGQRRNVGAVQIFSELTELRELEERANRHDRLAALGEMAAGVAHEINNPLCVIKNYVELLKRQPFSPETPTRLGKIGVELDWIVEIVGGMLSFAKPGETPLRALDPGGVMREALLLLGHRFRERGVRATSDIPGEL